MTDYQKGKIYRIICNTTGLVYYGSTCEPTLARRLAGHLRSYKCWKNSGKGNQITSFKVLENKNYEIVLVELAPSNNKMELHQRERYHIENNECVNTNTPLRTMSEWRADNCEHELQYRTDYYSKNRETILEYAVQYLEINRNTRKRERYIKNREKLIEDMALYRANNKHIFRAHYLKNKEKKAAYQIAYRLKQKEVLNEGLV